MDERKFEDETRNTIRYRSLAECLQKEIFYIPCKLMIDDVLRAISYIRYLNKRQVESILTLVFISIFKFRNRSSVCIHDMEAYFRRSQ